MGDVMRSVMARLGVGLTLVIGMVGCKTSGSSERAEEPSAREQTGAASGESSSTAEQAEAPEEPVEPTALTGEQIDGAVFKRLPAIRKCVAGAMKAEPDRKGWLVGFTIVEEGSVDREGVEVEPVGEDAGEGQAGDCLAEVFAGLEYPPATQSYDIVFPLSGGPFLEQSGREGGPTALAGIHVLPERFDPSGTTIAARWQQTRAAKALHMERHRGSFHALDALLAQDRLMTHLSRLVAFRLGGSTAYEACREERRCRWKPEKVEGERFKLSYEFGAERRSQSATWEVDLSNRTVEAAGPWSRALHVLSFPADKQVRRFEARQMPPESSVGKSSGKGEDQADSELTDKQINKIILEDFASRTRGGGSVDRGRGGPAACRPGGGAGRPGRGAWWRGGPGGHSTFGWAQ